MNNYFLRDLGPLLQSIATHRWLTPEEIYLLLVHEPVSLGLTQSYLAPAFPQCKHIFISERELDDVSFLLPLTQLTRFPRSLAQISYH